MRKYTVPLYWAILVFAVLAINMGCTVTPEKPDQVVFAAYGTYTAVNNTTADLLSQGAISVERAESIQSQLKAYRPLLDASRAAISQGQGLPEDNLQRLRLMQTVLLELQKELLRRQ